jgi:DNA-binding PadR family transcriptional regulator
MGYLKAYWGEATEGPRRKYYKITKDGKIALEMCLEEWTGTAGITTNIIESLSKAKDKRTQGSGKI